MSVSQIQPVDQFAAQEDDDETMNRRCPQLSICDL